MAVELLDRWVLEEPVVHTPLHDLESFVWLHSINAMQNSEAVSSNVEAKVIANVLNVMFNPDPGQVLLMKQVLQEKISKTSSSHPFWGLIKIWMKRIDDWKERLKEESLISADRYVDCYSDMIKSGLDWLKEADAQPLQQPWKSFNSTIPNK